MILSERKLRTAVTFIPEKYYHMGNRSGYSEGSGKSHYAIGNQYADFFGMRATGVDPVDFLVSPEISSDPTMMEALREELGLNDPGYVQYFRCLGQMLHGNFGTSMATGTPISQIVKNFFPDILPVPMQWQGINVAG